MATLQQLGTVRLRLRLGGKDYQETLHAVQGDIGRVIEFDVLDGDGTVVTDLTGVTPVLFVRRPDGKEVGSATGEIVGGVIRIPIPSSLLAYAGYARAQIQLIDSVNQHKLHDHLYRLHIEESLEAGASPGENLWFSLAELTEAIEEVHLLVEQYDTDVAAVATMRDDVTTKHGEVTTMHASLQDVYDTEQARRTAESARISAETDRQTAETERIQAESARNTAEDTRQTQETARQQAEAQRDTDEDTRVANEAIRETNEDVRVSQETTRETQESARQTLYQQLQALQEVLGTDPTVELAQAVAALQYADLYFLEAWRVSSHLIDPAKDLIAEAGTLYRLTHVIEDGSPWLKRTEVGKAILNGSMELTAPGNAPRMRLYWKAQGERSEAGAYIAAWAGDDQANQYVGEIDNYTRQYSAVFDLSATRTVTLSTLTAWGQTVRIWDMDWRVALEGEITGAGTTKSEIEKVIVQAIVDNQIVKQSEFTQHKLDYMPHRFENKVQNKTYKFGFQVSDGGSPQIIFEEVI